VPPYRVRGGRVFYGMRARHSLRAAGGWWADIITTCQSTYRMRVMTAEPSPAFSPAVLAEYRPGLARYPSPGCPHADPLESQRESAGFAAGVLRYVSRSWAAARWITSVASFYPMYLEEARRSAGTSMCFRNLSCA